MLGENDEGVRQEKEVPEEPCCRMIQSVFKFPAVVLNQGAKEFSTGATQTLRAPPFSFFPRTPVSPQLHGP